MILKNIYEKKSEKNIIIFNFKTLAFIKPTCNTTVFNINIYYPKYLE